METAKMPPELRRDPEDFATRYANNTQFESTSWDLKMTFGQTDVAQGQNVVIQHTAITLPWPYAKVFLYLLQTQIAAREAEDGHLDVPRNILMPPPKELPADISALMKHPKEGLAAVHKVWEEFLAANPEIK